MSDFNAGIVNGTAKRIVGTHMDAKYTEHFTVVFEGNIRCMSGNPYRLESAWGKPVGISMGDALDFKEMVECICWRPIETAPKDGSTFLVWNKVVGHLVVSFTDGDIPEFRGAFKHWAPLPEPPGEQIGKREMKS